MYIIPRVFGFDINCGFYLTISALWRSTVLVSEIVKYNDSGI